MSRVIWKFPLQIASNQILELPLGSQILCVQMQRGSPFLWAVVDPDAKTVLRQIKTYGTGHGSVEDTDHYIGTYQLEGGAFVYHVFASIIH